MTRRRKVVLGRRVDCADGSVRIFAKSLVDAARLIGCALPAAGLIPPLEPELPDGESVESVEQHVDRLYFQHVAADPAPVAADPIEFVATQLDRAYNAWISAAEIRRSYLLWAEQCGGFAVGPQTLCRALSLSGLRASRHRPPGGHPLERGWFGARFRPANPPQLQVVPEVRGA